MSDDYVGLNLGTTGGAEPEDTGRACPGCGEPAEFLVDAPTEEIAERVFVAYYATKNIPLDLLKAVRDGTQHIHIADGKKCDD